VGDTDLIANGPTHASLWSGAAASWVDLHPTGYANSYAYGVSDGQQVGFANGAGTDHAGLWNGSAASWVNLNPSGAPGSFAIGVSGGQQVGSAAVNDGSGVFRYHASLWSGSAASWTDLNPAGAQTSGASSVFDGHQVGAALMNATGVYHASLWSGTAASWVDLDAFLPAEFSSSLAHSIWSDGSFIYVAGVGYNTGTERQEALLWTRPVPEPTSLLMLGWGALALRRRGSPAWTEHARVGHARERV
jgi:hypothetical protein